MVRKVDMKKIEDITKCQVTFSKRRSSLIKKAHEISVCCDVDIAFITFSPSGRVSKFCSQRRIEDLIHRYINLPVDKRFTHIKNVQEKQEKIHQLDRIKGDTSKLQYLEKQVENLELQIKKRTLELQILEANIRDYELLPEQEPSLHQLMWCERNLKQSLEKVVARKVEMENQGGMPLSCYIDGRDLSWVPKSPPSRQLLMQLDPWISPYRFTCYQQLNGY
ncbi:agamous-like MADS-box protein AGL66 isoform X2 [Camellia sinensis]|uniref:agamous-like MADS-box protein AGL66 isoform X2 n=1 Tax=Camellia sinensis TaxID=4442 RepID=UPI001035DFC0|nr:agamous-like MADS-box protein AGL66 isoform X2 [Camellia sinensis]